MDIADFKTFGSYESEYFQKEGVEAGNKKYHLDLYDPFDKRQDWTVRSFGGLYYGKLDWCLLSSNLTVTNARVGCKSHQLCSDHCWLCVDVTPSQHLSNED